MTTTALSRTQPETRSALGGAARRIGSMARGEALLLRRNPLALLNALVLPLATVLVYKTSGVSDAFASRAAAAGIVAVLTMSSLLLVVYYNLVTALVVRRQELVLKRLRTGECSDAEVLAGTAAPAVALAWGQILVGVIAAVGAFGMGMPTNAVLVVTAVFLGTAVCVLLAAASTAMTRTAELAQITTAPVVIISLIFSGAMAPLDAFPELVQHFAHLLPLSAVTDLMRLGLTGSSSDAIVGFAASFKLAAAPVLVLTAWLCMGAWATRRWFRWEPRP